MTTPGPTRILVRATVLDQAVLALGDELSAASGHPVAYVVDERAGAGNHHGRDVVGVTVARCRALGLFCPPGFAWKCGDYAYYLARVAFPEAERFWMIEHDVLISGDAAESFFNVLDAYDDVDFIAAEFRESDHDWHWTATVQARDAKPFRCLFPVTRISARAVDAAHAKRVRQSRVLTRRLSWPNDEAHVATTLANGQFVCRDLNGFGPTFYTPETFSYAAPMDGDEFCPPVDRTLLYHPVLRGEAFRNKLARLQQTAIPASRRRAMQRRWMSRVNRFRRW